MLIVLPFLSPPWLFVNNLEISACLENLIIQFLETKILYLVSMGIVCEGKIVYNYSLWFTSFCLVLVFKTHKKSTLQPISLIGSIFWHQGKLRKYLLFSDFCRSVLSLHLPKGEGKGRRREDPFSSNFTLSHRAFQYTTISVFNNMYLEW